MYKLDPSIKIIWTINYLIKFTFYALIFLVLDFMFFNPEYFDIPIKTGVISLSLFILGILLSIFIPPLSYKYWSFEVKDNEIILQYGIFNRIKTLAPYSKVQHIDVQQSMIERMYDLSRLVLYTAGSRGADVILPGLPLQYAEELRDSLKDITSNESL